MLADNAWARGRADPRSLKSFYASHSACCDGLKFGTDDVRGKPFEGSEGCIERTVKQAVVYSTPHILTSINCYDTVSLCILERILLKWLPKF
jgi:hypothetical protein